MTGEARYNPAIHHRRSIRLQDYDYSQVGAYFITICVQNRECLFGEITNGEMKMNDIGRMVQIVWDEIPSRFDGLELNLFTIMPNHIHGIIMLNRQRRGESCIRPSFIRNTGIPLQQTNQRIKWVVFMAIIWRAITRIAPIPAEHYRVR
jgi:REP element-mobilizing transposase RayT